jgi:hypothetical protein
MPNISFPARLFNTTTSDIIDFESGQIFAASGFYDVHSQKDFVRITKGSVTVAAITTGDLILVYGTTDITLPPPASRIPLDDVLDKASRIDNTSIQKSTITLALNETPDGVLDVFTYNDPGNILDSSIAFYVNGVKQYPGIDFDASTPGQIQLLTGIPTDDDDLLAEAEVTN